MTVLYERCIAIADILNTICGRKYYAQTFTVGNTGSNVNHYITSVKLLMTRAGTPGMFIVSIRATDGAGLPTGADLTSALYDGDILPITDKWIEIALPPYLLHINTKYAIVIGAPDCPGTSHWLTFRSHDSNVYTGGFWCSSRDYGVSWNGRPSRDFIFYEYGYPNFIETAKIEDRSKLAVKQSNENKLSAKQSDKNKLSAKQSNKNKLSAKQSDKNKLIGE